MDVFALRNQLIHDYATYIQSFINISDARIRQHVDRELDNGKQLVLSWRGDPEAKVQCAPDGRLYLTGVELSAWQGISLPRHWDDPDREPDEEPDAQLADLVGRVWKALRAWERSVRHLQKG